MPLIIWIGVWCDGSRDDYHLLRDHTFFHWRASKVQDPHVQDANQGWGTGEWGHRYQAKLAAVDAAQCITATGLQKPDCERRCDRPPLTTLVDARTAIA